MLKEDPCLSNNQHDQTLAAAIIDRVQSLRHSRIAPAVFFGLSAVAVTAQPFGTYGQLEFGLRIVFWSVLIGVSIVCGAICDEISYRIVRPLVAWRAALVATGLMTLIFAPLVYLWSSVMVLLGGGLEPQFWSMSVNIFVPTMTVYSVIHILRPYLSDAPVTGTEEDSDPLPRLFNRLAWPQARVYRLSANDHLTEVATDRGVEQIRMRFADAVEEMAPVEGCHVHRSHWVPLDAVNTVQRRSGKLMVQLINGDELPVSRTYRPRLEEARPDLF